VVLPIASQEAEVLALLTSALHSLVAIPETVAVPVAMEVVALADIVLLVGMAAMEAADQLAPAGHRQLAVEAAEAVVVRTKQTYTAPALGSIMAAVAEVALVCLALAATA